MNTFALLSLSALPIYEWNLILFGCFIYRVIRGENRGLGKLKVLGRMRCTQVTACGPIVKTKSLSSSQSCISRNSSVKLLGTPLTQVSCTSRKQRCTTVCLFGNKGKPEKSGDVSNLPLFIFFCVGNLVRSYSKWICILHHMSTEA